MLILYKRVFKGLFFGLMQNIAMTTVQRVVVGCVFVGKYTEESKRLTPVIYYSVFCMSCIVCLCRSV